MDEELIQKICAMTIALECVNDYGDRPEVRATLISIAAEYGAQILDAE